MDKIPPVPPPVHRFTSVRRPSFVLRGLTPSRSQVVYTLESRRRIARVDYDLQLFEFQFSRPDSTHLDRNVYILESYDCFEVLSSIVMKIEEYGKVSPIGNC